MSYLGLTDYNHCKIREKTWHDVKKWDIFIGPGYGFKDLKSFVDRVLLIMEKFQFLNFF